MFSWVQGAPYQKKSPGGVTATCTSADRKALLSSITTEVADSSLSSKHTNLTNHGPGPGSGAGDVELGPTSRAYATARTLEEEEQALQESLLEKDGLEKAPRHSVNGGREAKHSRPDQGQSFQDYRDDGNGDSNGSVAATFDKGPPAGMGTAFAAKGRVSAWLMSPSPRNLFMFRVACVMIFFGMHNLLQEAIFAMEGFDFGWSIGLVETMGVVGGSFLERSHSGNMCKRVAPLRSYLILSGLLGASSLLSNVALKYIQYPTKVIFRSCKLIPTMAIAVLWRKKHVSRWEFLAATAVCAGMVIFGKAESDVEPDFDPRGIVLVLLSVCADAFLPNAQEQVFSVGASRVEVTFYSNLLTVVGIVVTTTANGNLGKFLPYAFGSVSAAAHLFGYAILAHVAIASHMVIVKEYGGVTAVLVGNTRKTMTIALSFLVFPKPFSYMYVLGGVLVLGGLAANVMLKERRKNVPSVKSHINIPDLSGPTIEATATPAAHSASHFGASRSKSEGGVGAGGASRTSTGDRLRPHLRRPSNEAGALHADRRQDGVGAGGSKHGSTFKRTTPGKVNGLSSEDAEAEKEVLLASSRDSDSQVH